MLDKIWRQFGRLHISSSMSQYALKTSLKQIFNIRFGHLIILISPNYHHSYSVTIRKCTRLNATPPNRLSITKPASQESILKDMQIYPKIYGGGRADCTHSDKREHVTTQIEIHKW